MPSISLSIPNPLGQQNASSRLKLFLTKLKERHQDKVGDLQEEWTGEHHLKYGFTTYGFEIKGDVAVEQDVVKLNATIPFAALMFKGKIEQSIRDELVKLLS